MTALDAAPQNKQHSRLSWGTRTVFLINGLGMSAWAPLVPFARDRLQLSGASLGALLLCLGMGSLAAMPVTGTLVARFGCRWVMGFSALLVLAMMPLLATADSHLVMAAALMCFGAGLGMLDVAMNYQAVQVEKAAGKPMMSGFHGFFSLGHSGCRCCQPAVVPELYSTDRHSGDHGRDAAAVGVALAGLAK